MLLLVSICVISMQCKDDGVAPPSGLDTTSHNFIFTQCTFGGQGGSSYFKDVAILDDGDIWAVGEIYTIDSMYNAAHWDGVGWHLKKINVNYKGNIITPPLEGAFAFSPLDIWMVGSFPIHGDGTSWTLYQLQDMGLSVSVSKAWGTSSSDIYFVGVQGGIVHYDGATWTKLASGTTLDVQDVFGAANPLTGATEVLAVASQPWSNFDRTILQISGTTVTTLPNDSIQYSLSTVWFVPGSVYYVAGSGVYQKHRLSEPTWSNGVYDITHYYIYSMRGNAANDIVAVGGMGEVLHYNGTTWKSYYDQTKLVYGNYYGVAIKGNVAVAVGDDSPRAIIAVGRR